MSRALVSTVSIALLILPVAVRASQTPKPSPRAVVTVIPASVWQMPDEARIARRAAAAAGADRRGEKVEGSRTPELFLRYELYDYLLWGVSDDGRRQQAARSKFDPKIRAFGYDVDRFWSMARAAADPYLELKKTRAKQGLHTAMIVAPGGRKVLIPINRDVCAARIAALEQTRETFGKDNFDRLLYTVVAPSMSHSSSSNAESDIAAKLRYMAGGCK